MAPPIQTRVLGLLRHHAKGVTVATVAQTLGLSQAQAATALESLYVSSWVECRRLGENLYRLLPGRN